MQCRHQIKINAGLRVAVILILGTAALCFNRHTFLLINQRTGGPLIQSTWGSGTLDRQHQRLWIGFGLTNTTEKPIKLLSVEVIENAVLHSHTRVEEIFMIGQGGPPPLTEDPRQLLVTKPTSPNGFILPPGSECGGFVQFAYSELPERGLTNLYTLEITYLIGSESRVYRSPSHNERGRPPQSLAVGYTGCD